jgi:pimeloyl-ACP methyl ester carboxylesterase
LLWIGYFIGVLLAVAVATAALSLVAARRIERAAPPQGGFLEIDGQRLHVLDRGQGPPVVLIHGLCGQIGNFDYALVERLTQTFHVMAFDRPGSGYSVRGDRSAASVDAQAATLAKAIRSLGLGRPIIVGHSLGGAVALALALDHPDCVGALALISPATHPIPKPPRAFRALAIRSPLLRRLFAWTVATPGGLVARQLAMREVFAPEAPPPDFAAAGGGLLALRPANVEAASADLIAAEMDLKSMPTRYPSITVPVGVLFGRGDRLLDWRVHGESMRQEIPSLDFQLVDGGHMLPVTQPDVCAAFIQRVAARMETAEVSTM